MEKADQYSDITLERIVEEIRKLRRYYRTVLLTGLGTAAVLLVTSFYFAGPWYVRIGTLWLGLSFLCADLWIYLGAYRRVRSQLRYYKYLYNLARPRRRRLSLTGIRRSFKWVFPRYSLYFAGGFFAALLTIAGLLDQYESNFFDALAQEVAAKSEGMSEDSVLTQGVHICHQLLQTRSGVFNNTAETSWIGRYIHPLTSDLLTAKGACGSYSIVLCRILQTLHYQTRLVQMKDKDGRVCHILVEALSSSGWVVLDPSYDHYFIRQDGGLASFEEVSANWHRYRSQVPRNYNLRYCYAGVQYTNWNKFPVGMPILRTMLRIGMSKEELEHFSLRTYFLRKYRLLEYAAGIVLLVLFIAPMTRATGKKLGRLFAAITGMPGYASQ